MDLKIVLPSHLFPQLLDQRAFELDDLATSGTDQVIMLSRVFELVIVMFFFQEMKLDDQAHLFEQVKGPVDGRQAETRILLPGQTIDFVGIEMPFTVAEDPEKQNPLLRYPSALRAQSFLDISQSIISRRIIIRQRNRLS
jgi:hypothetical protein